MKTLRQGFCGALLAAALAPSIAAAAQAPPASRPADVPAILARHGIQPHATPARAISGWRVPPKVLLMQISQRSINLQQFRAAAPGVEVYADEPFAAAPVVERLSLAARLVARGERVGDAAGLVVLPAQTWLDLDGLVSLSDDRIAIRARVANLLDDDATDTIGLPLPGRSFHIAGEAWWN